MSHPSPHSLPQLLDFVNALLTGKRPLVDYQRGSTDPYSCLVDQMKTMFDRGYIVDYPGMYAIMERYGDVRIAGDLHRETEDFRLRYPADTSKQSLSLRGIEAQQQFRLWLKEKGYGQNVLLAVYDHRLRREPGALVRHAAQHQATVILPGGLFALRSVLELIDHQRTHPETPLPPIYLVNPPVWEGKPYRFWDGLHDALEPLLGMPPRDRNQPRDWASMGKTLEALGIHLVDSVEQCQQKLQAQLASKEVKSPQADSDAALLPARYRFAPGATIFFSTTSPDKLEEMRKILAPYQVRVARLDQLTPSNSPEEKSGTYTGNCSEKMRESLKAVRELQKNHPEVFAARLRAMGVEPANAFIMVEDSGVHTTDRRIIKHLPLDGMEHGTRIHGEQGIGPEFGPATIGALGEKKFFESLNRAIDNANKDALANHRDNEIIAGMQAQEPRLVGRIQLLRGTAPARPIMVQTSVVGLAPIQQPDERDDYEIFSATQSMNVLRGPQPPTDRIFHAGHYLAPRGQDNPHGLSQVELDQDHDRFTRALSSRARAVKGMVLACQAPLRTREMDVRAADVRYHVHLQSQTETYVSQGLRGALGQHRYHLSKAASASDANPLAAAIEPHLAASEAAILMPFAAKHEPKAHLAARIYQLFSQIVARQIHPRDRDKPLIIYNPKEGLLGRCWDPILAYYDELREVGMIKDQKRVLLQEAASESEVLDLLELSRNNYLRTPGDMEAPGVVQEHELTRSNTFNVAVFCAATNKNQKLLDLARKTGFDLATQGFGLVFGAGNRSMMGEVLTGALRGERVAPASNITNDAKVFIAGSSTDAILKVEADNPEELKRTIDAHGQYYHAKDIYQRMQFMIKQSDAFLIEPGGAGTVQELAALMLLKQANHPDMRGKEIVVLDLPYHKAGLFSPKDERGFFTGLMEQIPQKEMFGIHVCKSLEEAQRTLEALRQKKQSPTHQSKASASDWRRRLLEKSPPKPERFFGN
jgi:predicted Rossmann-fold nucleotide-binding protein